MSKTSRHQNTGKNKPKIPNIRNGGIIAAEDGSDSSTKQEKMPTREENTAQDMLIIVNTDNKSPAKPGENDLIVSRRNRISVMMPGEDSELPSVVVQAYNRLDKTRQCIACIQKFTTEIDYELVLIDNGSTDGTLDFFKSIHHPRKKIIRVTKNLGTFIPIVAHEISGRFIVHLSNDVYVTKNWLTNLLTCLKSDDRIGFVVPLSSNVSALQTADITFRTLDEMQEKAAEFNQSNPTKWHERITLMPVVGAFRREVMDIIGGADYGFFHDFADDDIAFRVRRAGYKIMLCKDTFVHHDHIRTNLTDEEIKKYNLSLQAGKRDFKNKYFDLDAWDDVHNFEEAMMSLVRLPEHNEKQSLEILGVDTLCGTPILELKNKLRELGIFDVQLSAYSTRPKYWLDLKSICTGDVVVDRIDFLNEHFSGKVFDFVLLGKPLNAYHNPLNLLEKSLHLVKTNGHLFLKLRNTFGVLSLFKSLGAAIRIEDNNLNQAEIFQLDIDVLSEKIQKLGLEISNIVTENLPLRENDFKILQNLITATNFNRNPNEVLARAVVQDYVMDIVKK